MVKKESHLKHGCNGPLFCFWGALICKIHCLHNIKQSGNTKLLSIKPVCKLISSMWIITFTRSYFLFLLPPFFISNSIFIVSCLSSCCLFLQRADQGGRPLLSQGQWCPSFLPDSLKVYHTPRLGCISIIQKSTFGFTIMLSSDPLSLS